jgi:hypothetical protein
MNANSSARRLLTALVGCALLTVAAASAGRSSGQGNPAPAIVKAPGAITCSSAAPCQKITNTGSGNALLGLSMSGKGLLGQTKFNGSTSINNGQAGVNGQDLSGVGTFNAGVRGFSNLGFGALGISTKSSGVLGTSVDGTGVASSSKNGYGMEAYSGNNIGVHILGGGEPIPMYHFAALSIDSNSNSGNLIDACAPGAGTCIQTNLCCTSFSVSQFGDVYIAGQIFTAGSCQNGCAKTKATGERRVRLYTAQESAPTVEDFGRGQLVNGRGFVRIDPTFANIMDTTQAYLVFLSPEGDSKVLYTTDKTSGGFAVHESEGGRSTLAFDYRIVARPYGRHDSGLRMIAVSRAGARL